MAKKGQFPQGKAALGGPVSPCVFTKTAYKPRSVNPGWELNGRPVVLKPVGPVGPASSAPAFRAFEPFPEGLEGLGAGMDDRVEQGKGIHAAI